MRQRDEHFMRLALEQAVRSRLNGDFPFGAVITWRGNLLIECQNAENLLADVTAHAEIVAVRQACLRLERRDLSDCEIFSSCEPCPMCSAAIFQSNIKRVIFGLYRDDLPHIFRRRNIRIAQLAQDWDYKPEVVGGVLREEALPPFEGLKLPLRVVPRYPQSID
jgi:guanine deaminase